MSSFYEPVGNEVLWKVTAVQAGTGQMQGYEVVTLHPSKLVDDVLFLRITARQNLFVLNCFYKCPFQLTTKSEKTPVPLPFPREVEERFKNNHPDDDFEIPSVPITPVCHANRHPLKKHRFTGGKINGRGQNLVSIINVMKVGGDRIWSATEIAAETGIPYPTVASTLYNHQGKRFLKVGEGRFRFIPEQENGQS
jgi:hypothetical protein